MNDPDLKRVGQKAADKGKIFNRSLKITREGQSLPSDNRGKQIQSSWRSIEDDLPERNAVVLVCFKSGFDDSLIRTMAYRIYKSGRWRWSTDLVYEEPNGYNCDDIEVTHWMPLPEFPQKKIGEIR
ncbi:MAG: DUF551 domain-containing protein [Desulfobacterales bacterium]|jgi:hypothetical protein